MTSIPELAKELMDLKNKINDINESLIALKEREANIEKTLLPELMDEQDIQSINIQGVGSVYKKLDAFVHVKKENEKEFFDWLVDNGEDSIIKATVHPGTLKSWAKTRVLAGQELPEVVKYTPTAQAVLRKA